MASDCSLADHLYILVTAKSGQRRWWFSFFFPHFNLLQPGGVVLTRPEPRLYISTVDLRASLDHMNMVLVRMLVSVLGVNSLDLGLVLSFYAETMFGWLLWSIWCKCGVNRHHACIMHMAAEEAGQTASTNRPVVNEACPSWFIPNIALWVVSSTLGSPSNVESMWLFTAWMVNKATIS